MTDRDLRALFNRIAESSTASRNDIEILRHHFHKAQEDASVYKGFWEDLRDRFAMAALSAMTSDVVRIYHACLFDGKAVESEDHKWAVKQSVKLAEISYVIADAMMKARKVRPLNDEIVNNKFIEYRHEGEPQQ